MDAAPWPKRSLEEFVPSASTTDRRIRQEKEQALNCPRCSSGNIKFCYYNNYSFSQPRYFCKTCRRYWTQGGTLRDVPVGGGTRKKTRSSSSSSYSAASSARPDIEDSQFSGMPVLDTGVMSGSPSGSFVPVPDVYGCLDDMWSRAMGATQPGFHGVCVGREGDGRVSDGRGENNSFLSGGVDFEQSREQGGEMPRFWNAMMGGEELGKESER